MPKLTSMRNAFSLIQEVLSEKKCQVKKGFMARGTQVSWVLFDLYSMAGIHAITKAAIINMRVASLIPRINGVFDLAILGLEHLKAIHYASMFPISAALFFRKGKDGLLHLQLPKKTLKDNKEEYDFVKLLYSIGGVCDLVAYMHKLNALHIELFTVISNKIGEFTLFTFKSTEYRLRNIVVLSSIPESPKELFFFLASVGECYRWGKSWVNRQSTDFREGKGPFDIAVLCKLLPSIGRVFGLGLHRHYKGSWILITLDLFAQNANLAAVMIVNKRKRQDVFQNLD